MTDRSRAFFVLEPSFSVMLPAKDLLISSTIFLLRASEALNSLQEYLGLHLATKTLVVVFPMPGGPLIRAARAFRFSGGGRQPLKSCGYSGGGLVLPCSTTSSQSLSHCASFLTCSVFPTTCPRCLGRCLSAQGKSTAGLACFMVASGASPCPPPTQRCGCGPQRN